MEEFKVSVCMITYNHEKFIQQAIEGVMMQITSFPVKLIIGEDCSTDKTRSICIEYQKKYPERIQLILQEKNLGAIPNFIQNLNNCIDGYKYVAICEGDDYWIDPYKLQKQIDYLESHTNLGLVYTDTKILIDDTKEFVPKIAGVNFFEDKRVISELMKTNYIEFASVVFRVKKLKVALDTLIPQFNKDSILADTPLILEFAQNSKLGYIPEETTVYRINQGSLSRPLIYDKFLTSINEPYLCRKKFLSRYNLNKKLLAVPVCNYNRALIQKAGRQSSYYKALKLISHIKIKDTILFCDMETFKKKIDFKMMLKLFFSISGISALRMKIILTRQKQKI